MLHTNQCADLYGRPTTVDPRDNLVLYGVHAVQKAFQRSVRSIGGVNGYRTTPNTSPYGMTGLNSTNLNSRSTIDSELDTESGCFVAMGQSAQCEGEC